MAVPVPPNDVPPMAEDTVPPPATFPVSAWRGSALKVAPNTAPAAPLPPKAVVVPDEAPPPPVTMERKPQVPSGTTETIAPATV